jgi:o-succinylbenzoate---CoA ligase
MAHGLEIFSNSESAVLLNPKLLAKRQQTLEKAALEQALINHIWLTSSGTEQFRLRHTKLVALSKNALLSAAESVVKQFAILSSDVYLNTLPLFHVGGLSTLARARVSGCAHLSLMQKWNPEEFVQYVLANNVTICSLVPTQLFDLVDKKLSAPVSLKCVFIGGGALSQELQTRAQQLGWRCVATYGMTETAAMVGYKEGGESYQLFSHIENMKNTPDGRLCFRSPALFSGYLFVDEQGGAEFLDPKVNGWFESGDRGNVEGRTFTVYGRESELVKINGESVSLFEMNVAFEKFLFANSCPSQFLILAVPEARRGHQLILCVEGSLDQTLIEQFNTSRLPFERIQVVKNFSNLPRTPLGKVDISALKRLL